MLSEVQEQKLNALKSSLREAKKVAVAFSGGVDSTLLLAIASEELGADAIAITNDSAFIPKREFDEAVEFCRNARIRHLVMKSDELSNDEIKCNSANRCYVCKKDLFIRMKALAKEHGFDVLAEGSNADDRLDYRPGFKAVCELGVKSPLLETGLSKQDIRDISKEMGLPTWDKQSFACLASRFPYGDEITFEGLQRVDSAEQLLLDLGVSYSRVRIHGDLARIEVLPNEFDLVMRNRETIAKRFEIIGFAYVALDLKGYRTGSMNETLGNERR